MHDDPRLDKLRGRIEKATQALKTTSAQKESSLTRGGKFFNVGVELVAGVLSGVGIGLFIDWAFGTSPWGLIVLFILGSAAGMLNVYRALVSIKNKKNLHD